MIYLDNHATTRCDPRVVEAMLPWFSEHYGNPHSGHPLGQEANAAVEQAIESLAEDLGVPADSIVMTSGATESNHLAIIGACTHPRQKRRHIVTVTTEHPAVLDVFDVLETQGFRVTRVPVAQDGEVDAGVVDLNRLADAIDDETALVSVMWANNEIGAIAPMAEIADLCHQSGALFHSDATQAVGRLPVDAKRVDVDLLSATAHKFYGPKGTGLLVVGNSNRRVRLRPLMVGGGQQHGLRSGTVNPAGTVGIATALRLCSQEISQNAERDRSIRDSLWSSLNSAIEGLRINGPAVNRNPAVNGDSRLTGNLNFRLPNLQGQAWMAATPGIAFSSGSACSASEAKPSHVLSALGLNDSEAGSSVRLGVGRFNSIDEIEDASNQLIASFRRLLE
ncbi:MAG: cysteine desulfurase family protein [Rubripirellula sp.]|nr:cysteine desulfurase family protein [Rubripirellula sp.]